MKRYIALVVMLLVLTSGCTGKDSDVCEVTPPSETVFPKGPAYSQGEIANRSLNYILDNFLTRQGLEGELVGNEEYGENLYRLTLQIGRGGQRENTTLFVTKDGKLIIPGQGGGMVDIFEERVPAQTAPPATTAPTRVEVGIEGSASLGPENASVVIVEFSEFQCPFCKRFHDNTLPLILGNYGDKVKFVFRHFIVHESAQKAAEASECAHEQGKFWEYHDLLFAKSPALEVVNLKQYAVELGLNSTKFDECLDSGKYVTKVQKDMQDGRNAGVTGTPAFFVNDQFISGAREFSVFEQAIEAELAKQG